MRNSREVLNIVCGNVQRKENIVLSSEVPPSELENICHDVFLITDDFVDDLSRAQISTYAKKAVMENEAALLIAQKAVLRVYDCKMGPYSGTAFFLAPGIIATNWHVVSKGQPPLYFSNNSFLPHHNFFGLIKRGLTDDSLCKEKKVIASGSTIGNDHQVEEVISGKSRVDPILGLTGDFGLFDFALINVDHPKMPKVLLIPSPQVVQPDSRIATVNYPGSEELNDTLLKKNTPADFYKFLPSFSYLGRIFHKFGRKCVSFGKTLRPYGPIGNQWRELSNYTADLNQYAIVSDETVMLGSSGAPVISLENCKSHKVLDIEGQEWALVEFVGIHAGGEYFDCLDCFCQTSRLVGHFKWIECTECQQDPSRKKTHLTYNHSISVHHPDFVKYYKRFVVPVLQQLFAGTPSCIEDYLNLHKATAF